MKKYDRNTMKVIVILFNSYLNNNQIHVLHVPLIRAPAVSVRPVSSACSSSGAFSDLGLGRALGLENVIISVSLLVAWGGESVL